MEETTCSVQEIIKQRDLLRKEFEEFRLEAEEYERELEIDNREKEKEIETLSRKLETSSRKLEDSRKEVTQLTKIAERENDKMEKQTEELNGLKAKLVCLEQYIEALENQVRQSEFDKEEFREKFNILEEEFILQKETYEEELCLKEEEVERLRQEIMDFQAEINALKLGRQGEIEDNKVESQKKEIEGTPEEKKILSKRRLFRSGTIPNEINKEGAVKNRISMFEMTSKSKSIGKFGHLKCGSASGIELSQKREGSDIYQLRPLVGSGISFLWERLFPKMENGQLKEEINMIFQKIQAEIKGILDLKLNKARFDSQILTEKQTNAELKAKLETLSSQLQQEREALNKKLGHSNLTENSQESTCVSYERDASVEDNLKNGVVQSIEGKSWTASPMVERLRFEISEKEETIKDLDDVLSGIEKELKALSGESPLEIVSSFRACEEQEEVSNPDLSSSDNLKDQIMRREEDENTGQDCESLDKLVFGKIKLNKKSRERYQTGLIDE